MQKGVPGLATEDRNVRVWWELSLDKIVFASFSVDITQLVYAKVTAACEMNVAWPGGGGNPNDFLENKPYKYENAQYHTG